MSPTERSVAAGAGGSSAAANPSGPAADPRIAGPTDVPTDPSVASADAAAVTLTGPQLRSAAETFALLATPVRLHLVWLAARGPQDVGTLARLAGVTVATASQHLAKLRGAGVVTVHHSGRHHIYAVDDPHILGLVEQIFEHIAPDGGLAPDPPPPDRGYRVAGRSRS
ncbi:ArsR/SmtB family transcription factor [Nakamurella alba]|uniref:ArsR/SmtB family transcription factor n=1 Tax=Nakamurella alba TaxID=2665158 RepID=UPI002AC33D55|nr:metalloregulator ArsR/SmtB family transcription factor [Nakamurella alba]